MKDEYLIWKRIQEQMHDQIATAQQTVHVNEILLCAVNLKIKKLERAGKVPKFKDEKKTNTSIG